MRQFPSRVTNAPWPIPAQTAISRWRRERIDYEPGEKVLMPKTGRRRLLAVE
jgi:hypothetical protein